MEREWKGREVRGEAGRRSGFAQDAVGADEESGVCDVARRRGGPALVGAAWGWICVSDGEGEDEAVRSTCTLARPKIVS